MGRDGKRFTIRVGRRAPQRATSVRSQRAKRASLRPAASGPGTPTTTREGPSDHDDVTPARTSDAAIGQSNNVDVIAPATGEQLASATHTPAPAAVTTTTTTTPIMSPPPKKKGLFKRIAAKFRGEAVTSQPSPPRRSLGEFGDREARNAALRARGLLPPQDMSALEAAQDARLDQERKSGQAPIAEGAPLDEGPSAAKEIIEQWKRRHSSLSPSDEAAEPESATKPEFVLAPLPPPPPRRLSQASSQVLLPDLVPSPPASATFHGFGSPPRSPTTKTGSITEEPTSILGLGLGSPTKVSFALSNTPRSVTPTTPRRANAPPPIVLTPSKPTFSFDSNEPFDPSQFPLPPSPSPSANSGTFGPSTYALPSSPALLSPGAQALINRSRSNTSTTDTTLPSLSVGEMSDESVAPSTPQTANIGLCDSPVVPLACDVIIEEPLSTFPEDEHGGLAPLPSAPPSRAKRSSTLPSSSVAPSRSKSLLLTGLKRGLTGRRPAMPKSPTSPKAAAVEASLKRGPSTRLASTTMHDRGTISDQTSKIQDDEERRLAEMAFLDF